MVSEIPIKIHSPLSHTSWSWKLPLGFRLGVSCCSSSPLSQLHLIAVFQHLALIIKYDNCGQLYGSCLNICESELSPNEGAESN